jgi:hypothetical protein
MSVPTGTFQTYQAIGNKEDVSDLIFNISPTETPFTSMCKKVKSISTLHEWQTDALDAAADNAQVQGDAAATNTATPTVRLRNYTQILRKVAQVAGTQEAVDKYGRDSEMEYQLSKRMPEIKRDLEYISSRNLASSAGSASVAAHMASLESWIATNKTSVGTGTAQTTPGYSSGTVVAPTDSTVKGSVAESHLQTVIQACWTAGGQPNKLLVGPGVKSKISTAFNGVATRYREVPSGQAAIVSGVDLYVSNFGEFTIVPSRFCRDQNILVLDMRYWALAALRPFFTKKLPDLGDAAQTAIYGEYTLESRQEAASGKITDIDTAK